MANLFLFRNRHWQAQVPYWIWPHHLQQPAVIQESCSCSLCWNQDSQVHEEGSDWSVLGGFSVSDVRHAERAVLLPWGELLQILLPHVLASLASAPGPFRLPQASHAQFQAACTSKAGTGHLIATITQQKLAASTLFLMHELIRGIFNWSSKLFYIEFWGFWVIF